MKRYICILMALLCLSLPSFANHGGGEDEKVDIKEIIFGHLADSYEWHIAGEVVIPLPCILYDGEKGFDVFLSNKLEGGEEYDGYHIDEVSGKIVNEAGVRPFDISITKNVLEIFFVCIILCSVFLGLARWYKKNGYKKAPGGFVGMMEILVNFVDKDISKNTIGHGYGFFSPYLMMVFFFILTCNLLGLIPVFPGGANVTGNIAITMFCAVTAFLAINLFGTKHYFKEIFWPEVPIFLKPIMIPIEFIGVFTKPFSLTIRLFANIMAGHIIILALNGTIFVTWQLGPQMGAPMTVVSVLFSIFMNCLELLVAFVQTYVFTILTANFVALAQVHEE